MSYQPGKMGVAEAISLIYFATIPTVFLGTPAANIEEAGTAAYLAPLLAGLMSLGIYTLLLVVFRKYPGDLFDVATTLVGRTAARLITLYYASFFFLYAALHIRQFAENTLLTALPAVDFFIITGWYALAAAVLLYAGIEALARTGYIYLPFAIISLMLGLLLALPFYNINFLFPLLGNGVGPLLHRVFVGQPVGQLAGILLFVLAPAFQTSRVQWLALTFGLGGSIATKVLANLSFGLIFGQVVGPEKALPFFEVARLIYLNRYIQRVEAIFILLWASVGILTVAISLYMMLYLLARLLNYDALRPLIPAVVFLTAGVSMLPSDISTVILIERTLSATYFSVGLYLIPLLLYAAAWRKGRSRRCPSG